MLFFLSQVISLFLKPLNLIILLGVSAGWATSPRVRRRRAYGCVGMLIFFSNPWIANQAAGFWEVGNQPLENLKAPYAVGILLGGYSNLAVGPLYNTHHSGNRLLTTLQLYQQGKIRRILLSGGSGDLWSDWPPEANTVHAWLCSVGVPDSVILVENRSRNTRENALYTRALLDSLHLTGQRPLLITSAWHLRRATACFERVGLSCDPLGTDYFYQRHPSHFFQWLEPNWNALMQWEGLLRECVGYAFYRLRQWA